MSDTLEPSDVLTLEEAAQLLRCHPRTVKRNADALNIPYRRLGSLWRFSRVKLDEWMRKEAA
jgi:excisionase family DNA binding protein